MKSKSSMKRLLKTAIVVFVLFVSANSMVFSGGQPPEDTQVAEFGVRVEAPKEWEGYQIVIEELGRKPETLEYERLFWKGLQKLEHFRYIINLNIYARNLEDPYDIREIASFAPNIPDIIVTISFSDYDYSKTPDPILFFWIPQQEGGYWERAEVFEKDISEFSQNKNFVSFKVINWPVDDRAIASGG